MQIGRRELILAGAAAVVFPGFGETSAQKGRDMFGLIGKMTTVPGQREALIQILLEGSAAMPGCLSYIVARDQADDNALWITEVWDSRASHEASLELPAVRNAIAGGKALIAGLGERIVTTPVGGHGLTVRE